MIPSARLRLFVASLTLVQFFFHIFPSTELVEDGTPLWMPKPTHRWPSVVQVCHQHDVCQQLWIANRPTVLRFGCFLRIRSQSRCFNQEWLMSGLHIFPPTRQSPMIAVWPLTTESWVPQYHLNSATVNLHQVKRHDMVRLRFPLQLALSSNLVRSPERLQVGCSESDGNGCVGH